MPATTNKRSLSLLELSQGVVAHVECVDDRSPSDPIARRLRDLGFVKGEPVRIVAAGPFGRDPLLVQIGFTRFALRQAEASRVMIHSVQD